MHSDSVTTNRHAMSNIHRDITSHASAAPGGERGKVHKSPFRNELAPRRHLAISVPNWFWLRRYVCMKIRVARAVQKGVSRSDSSESVTLAHNQLLYLR